MNKKTVYITSSIPYVNAQPHIGYALEAVQTDAFARFHRQRGYDAYFLAGTDENALKNVESAEKQNIPVQELVDKNSKIFFELKDALHLSFDQFIRTSSQKHFKGAQKFWSLCIKDIYKKTYEGLYCVGCETFYKDGEFEGNICSNHNRKLELVSEENYFFKLSNYQEKLEQLIESDTIKIYPEYRKQEVLHFIKSGLEDFSISRPKERAKGWGIPVPGDLSQHMYVWFDALTNYITALDFADDGTLFKKFWVTNENRYHVIGKDIVKFHAIYWPAMLLSANLPLPKKIYAHGFITVDGKKMSKTLGNVIDPFELAKQYGVDAVRYYLLREIPSLDDGDFSHHRMQQIYDNDLANELGNCLSRLTTLAEKDGLTVPDTKNETDDTVLIEAFRFNEVLENIWTEVKNLNREINEFEPWSKSADDRKQYLTTGLQRLSNVGKRLLPFLPTTAETLTRLTSGTIKKAPMLFPKNK